MIFMGGLKALVERYKSLALRTTKPSDEKCEVTHYRLLWDDDSTKDGAFSSMMEHLANCC